MLIQTILFMIYPSLLLLAMSILWRLTNFKQTLTQHWKSLLLFFILSFVFLNTYTIWHMSQENFIYYWDFSGFWRRQIELNGAFHHDPISVFKIVYQSILSNEYSSFPQLLLLPHTLIVGISYPRYVLAMVNSFLIPALSLMYLWILSLVKTRDIYFKISLTVLLIFFTGNALPMYLGYVGTGGLFWIVFVLWLLFDFDDSKISPLRYLIIGLSLVVLLLIRRWFSYFAISVFSVYPLLTTIKHLINHDYIKIKHVLINFLMAGLSSLSILVIFFFSLFKTFISYNYSYAYQSVYTGLSAVWPWLNSYYSPFLMFLMILGIFLSVRNKDVRIFSLYSLLSMILITLLFYQIQIFGSHHYYIINVLALSLMSIALHETLKLLRKRYLKFLFTFIFSGLMLSNWLIVFLPWDNVLRTTLYTNLKPYVSTLHAPPRVNKDVDTLRDMVVDLQQLADEYEYIYVLAGSSRFNDDLLRNAFLPEQYNPLPTIENTRQLDTRDGLPKDFFYYTYVLVASPTQYHNGAQYQKVIGVLAEAILSDEELRSYYYHHKTYHLSLDIEVYLFERINDIPDVIKDRYSKIFEDLYPDNPNLFPFN